MESSKSWSPVKLGNMSQQTGRETGVFSGPLIGNACELSIETHPRYLNFGCIFFTAGKDVHFQYLFQPPLFIEKVYELNTTDSNINIVR